MSLQSWFPACVLEAGSLRPTTASGQMGPPFPASIQAGTQGREGQGRAWVQGHILFRSIPTHSGCSPGPMWRGLWRQEARPRVISAPFGLGASCRLGEGQTLASQVTVISGTMTSPPYASVSHLHPQRDVVVKVRGNTRGGLPWWLSGKKSACQCGRHRFDL